MWFSCVLGQNILFLFIENQEHSLLQQHGFYHINKILIICFIKSEPGPSASKTNFPSPQLVSTHKVPLFFSYVHRMVSLHLLQMLNIWNICIPKMLLNIKFILLFFLNYLKKPMFPFLKPSFLCHCHQYYFFTDFINNKTKKGPSAIRPIAPSPSSLTLSHQPHQTQICSQGS